MEIARKIGSGIINLNLTKEVCEYDNLKLKMVGISAKNREEWLNVDIATILYGFTTIPVNKNLIINY
jgi:hypothetical protein